MLSLPISSSLFLLLLSSVLPSSVSAAGAHHSFPDHHQSHHRALAARQQSSSASSSISSLPSWFDRSEIPLDRPFGVPPSNGERRKRSNHKRALCSSSASGSRTSSSGSAKASSSSLPAFSLGVVPSSSSNSASSPSSTRPTASVSLLSSSNSASSAYSTLDSGNGILTLYTTHWNTATVTSTYPASSTATQTQTLNNIVIPVSSSSTSSQSQSPAQASTSSSVSTVDPSGSGPFSGDGTWFGTGLGACGNTNVASDHIVAVSKLLFDAWPGATSNPNTNPICNQKLAITYNGQTVTATVADRCLNCATRDLDMTTGLFEDLLAQGESGLDVGRVAVTWSWV